MMAEDPGRRAALEEIRRLAAAHAISSAEIAAALGAAERSGGDGVLRRVTAYLGGLFVFAGIAAFIGVNWDAFPAAARVLMTLGLGLSLYAAALILDLDGRWPMLVTPVYLAALALEPTGMMIAFDEYGRGGDARWAALLTGLAIALQTGLSFAGMRPGPGHGILLFATIGFGASFWGSAFGLSGVAANWASLSIGAALLLASIAIESARYPWNSTLWALIGSTISYLALWELLEHSAGEALFAVFAVAGVYISIVAQSRSLLFTSVCALLFYIGYFTAEHFAESLGWPLALIFIGIAFVAVGNIALRLRQRYFARPGSADQT